MTGFEIKSELKRLGISIIDVARESSYSVSHCSKMLSGYSPITPRLMDALNFLKSKHEQPPKRRKR